MIWRFEAGDDVQAGAWLDGALVGSDDTPLEIGADATRFTYLLQSVDTKQTFDLELAASKAMDNPVFYVQMAHARLRNIQAKAAEAGVERG